ncbi:MAG: UDP-N-acetylmuramate dehydrogenase [Deltaproteobacteria bacterium]|nr:UDP-N-acetylmuramate dehydrogenase [Deltaproteobacteria bacterium]
MTERSLAAWSTLGVGGEARALSVMDREDAVIQALRAPGEVIVLGGGSNVLIADEGVDAHVIVLRTRGLRWGQGGSVRAAAGERWDALVEGAAARGLAGVECLAGIPGSVGAAPVQNIGAYGQEVAEVLRRVRVFDRDSGEARWWDREELAPSYRHTALKGDPRRVVLEVELGLTAGPPAPLRHGELRDRVGVERPTHAQVRAAVLGARGARGMLPDSGVRSAGSFFTNPVVPADRAAALKDRFGGLPCWPEGEGRVKLAAGWLIERAGFPRGTTRGLAGLSPLHALALVNLGGARAADLLALAREVQRGVLRSMGVWLRPEPVLLGFAEDPLAAPPAG